MSRKSVLWHISNTSWRELYYYSVFSSFSFVLSHFIFPSMFCPRICLLKVVLLSEITRLHAVRIMDQLLPWQYVFTVVIVHVLYVTKVTLVNSCGFEFYRNRVWYEKTYRKLQINLYVTWVVSGALPRQDRFKRERPILKLFEMPKAPHRHFTISENN